jgi:hypothetical protein
MREIIKEGLNSNYSLITFAKIVRCFILKVKNTIFDIANAKNDYKIKPSIIPTVNDIVLSFMKWSPDAQLVLILFAGITSAAER